MLSAASVVDRRAGIAVEGACLSRSATPTVPLQVRQCRTHAARRLNVQAPCRVPGIVVAHRGANSVVPTVPDGSRTVPIARGTVQVITSVDLGGHNRSPSVQGPNFSI
jgi:hypothetical protein